MKLSRQAILDKTHYGLHIFAHVLREYYPGETNLSLSGKICKPAKNPFNGNNPSLIVYNEENTFRFRDTELPDFYGDAFDFAAKLYLVHDYELLILLNQRMNLGLDERISSESCLFIPSFSLFLHPVSNVIPFQTINLREAWNLITSTYNKELTMQLREIKDSKSARKFKATQFDYATFSGLFTKRNDNALISHSGLLTIDFDHISDLQQLKKQLLQDEYFETELLFVSPSGDGLKWIIPINISEASHQNFFQAIANYIKEVYQQEVDKSGKDISRACFLPHDPKAYINPKYLNAKTQKNETK